MDRADLAANAFKVNNVYFEDVVTGYKTLNTTGREALTKDLTLRDSDKADGTTLVRSRFPYREIEVEYFIESNSYDFQSKYETLMQYCNVEHAKIIFNDEADKYLIGTLVAENDIDKARFTHSGVIKIICTDPFKYSNTEYTQSAVNGEFSVTYNGTYKSYPTLVATFPETLDGSGDNTDTSQCGYVGYVNQREAVLQFGDPNETDWADVTHPATVPVNRQFKSTTDWSTNSSSVITGTQTGTIGVSTDHIYPSAYGSGTGYHGPALSYIVTGETPPIGKNFNFTWKQKIAATKKQFGGVAVMLWNYNSGSRTLVGAVQILKTTKDTKCKVYLYCGSTTASKSYSVAVSKVGTGSMKKVGNKITYTVAGKTYSLASDTITDLIADEITFHFMKNGSQTALGSNFVYSCQLQRTSFDNYEDVPNIFAAGDVLTVETQNAAVYLDDGSATIPATYLGALGNDWEEFYLTSGTNTIAVDYSDFTTTAPIFTIKYRERYL